MQRAVELMDWFSAEQQRLYHSIIGEGGDGGLLAWIEQGLYRQHHGPTHIVCGCRGANDDVLRLVRVVRVTPDLQDATVVVLADHDDEIVAAAAHHAGADACYAKTQIASRLAQWSREVLALSTGTSQAA